MFEQNERVCILNEFGQYAPYTFKGYIDDIYCQLVSESDGAVTELISNVIKLSVPLKILEQQITECFAMIDHFIVTNNEYEIKSWRRMLQANKLQKRRLLKP